MTTIAVLITIPLSHYCEKARWGLDRLAFPYREEPHAPLLHRLATKRNNGATVPMLVHGDQRFIDSTDILMYADELCGGDLLYPRDAVLRREVAALEEQFDTQLGPNARRWAYQHLLPDKNLIRSLWSREVPPLEKLLLPLVTPLARRLVRAGYKVTPESAQRSFARVQEVFRNVEQLLSDGRGYLVGNRFTAADLTFASLAAPVLFPAQCGAVLPALDAIPAPMREEVLCFRATASGRFAVRLFSQERDRTVAAPRPA